MAPTQQWFEFLLSVDAKFGLLDEGAKSSSGNVSTPSNEHSSETNSSDESNSEISTKLNSEVEELDLSVYGDGKTIPDAPMIDYERMKKRYMRQDPLTQLEVSEAVTRIKYYAGQTLSDHYSPGLANGLIVNKRKGKVFERSKFFEFKNQHLKVRGIETRAACHVQVIHPTVGAMAIYSLHLDHMWEKNRIAQLNQLFETISASSTPLPHIIMGDFNAITKSDYTPEYEDEMITKVRENGRWEPPTYTLTQLIADHGYVDFWRRTNPAEFDSDVSTCAYHTRIDYIFLSKDLAELVDFEHTNTYCHILNGVFHSDHFPVLANIQFKQKAPTAI